MISTPRRSVSVWFFVAFWLALLSIGGTILNNREKAQRGLENPVLTVGTIKSLHCSTSLGVGASRRHFAALEYEYFTTESVPRKHILNTAKYFDSPEDCAAFAKTSGKTETLWYENEQPEKASLYKAEPDSWVGLYGLIPAMLFVLLAVYDQKSINKEKRETQKVKKTLNRLNRERKA